MASQTENKHTTPINCVEILSEFVSQNVDKALISNVPFDLKRNTGSKVLVCHDMNGGYLDDKFINGSDHPDSYTFYHWAQIDIFVYFSHHMVTIPPLVWVDVAHKNGVSVLGTFITEWDEGAENCSIMFKSVESTVHFAKQLAEIAHTYNFDGWIVNIENTLSLVEVSNVQVFLQVLSAELKTRIPHGLVIWYDAVTCQGELKWQDSVTDLNSCFFQCCDGIFLNYTWKDWQLQLTMELCFDRKTDVFVGIDVWARGCVGKFDCFQSTEKILSHGFSTALFAPAWCYEKNIGEFSDYLRDNNKFWNLLLSTCPPKPIQRTHNETISSNFNFGFGQLIFEYGFLLGSKPWYNISKQDNLYINFCNDESFKISINSDDAFEGSTSVKVSIIDLGLKHLDKLFCINVWIDKGKEIILVCKGCSKLEGLELLLSDKNGIQQTLKQISNSFIGGNSWRRIAYETQSSCDTSWIGLKFNDYLMTTSINCILIGQIKIS